MARVAAIDIGTNSVKMSVADVSRARGVELVRETSEITRLGKGVDKTKRLADDAVERTLATIERFATDAKSDGAGRIAVVGTSALRDAENGATFIRDLRTRTGLDIEIIAGKREAQLAYLAVRSDPSIAVPDDAMLAVFDIGGGSTELNVGLGSELLVHESLDIGAVRLTERFLHSDPPTADQIAQATRYAEGLVGAVAIPSGRVIAAGIGGTVVNLVAIGAEGDVHAATVAWEGLAATISRLESLSVDQLRAVPRLETARADVIVGGGIILEAVVRHIGVAAIRVSTRGLRFGLLSEMIE